MNIVYVRREMFLLPEGTRPVVFAKNQQPYLELPALVTPDGKVISQWQPTPGDLALLNQGVPVTLIVHHGELRPDNLLKPVTVTVGGVDLR